MGKLEKLQKLSDGNKQEQIKKLQAEITKLEEQIKIEQS
ncbi:MAG: hypothetical protein MRERC_5c027 [Mycoplasmataceae bacterium RC_NB112A]|nr:MAG: hypothetical protein MRERC_5c027 [Mycoplasmataceae bacterium RC_NB112A]